MELLAKKYFMGGGFGKGSERLSSFDKALMDAGVGNYNLVRLSSILPAGCVEVDEIDLTKGSLLPVAYSAVSSDRVGDVITASIAIGFPTDKSRVGVIMEYSAVGKTSRECKNILKTMIEEAFEKRGWELSHINYTTDEVHVDTPEVYTAFACVAEW